MRLTPLRLALFFGAAFMLLGQTTGLTQGKKSKSEQFSESMKAQLSQRGTSAPAAPPSGSNLGTSTGDLDKDAEDSFRRRDRNNEGFLTWTTTAATQKGELSGLRDQWAQWDKNKDGKIDLAEYKDFYKHQMARLGGGPPSAPNIIPGTNSQPPEEDKRPTVYHLASLPKDLPGWFVQMDYDRDGQVGLYEWKRGGLDSRLFMAIDQNGDGFLTVEEVLRYQKAELMAKKRNQSPGALLAYDEFGETIEGRESQPLIPSFTPNTKSGRGGLSGEVGGQPSGGRPSPRNAASGSDPQRPSNGKSKQKGVPKGQ